MVVSLWLIGNNVVNAQTASNSTNVAKLNSMMKQGYDFREINFKFNNSEVFALKNNDGKMGVILRNGQWLVEPTNDYEARQRYGFLCLISQESDETSFIYIDTKKGKIVCSVSYNDSNANEKKKEMTLALVNYMLNGKFQTLPNGCDYISTDQGNAAKDGFCMFKSENDEESVIDKVGKVIISGKRSILYMGNNVFFVQDKSMDCSLIEIK